MQRDLSPKNTDSVLILGAGNYGTCLAQHLAGMGHHVQLWARSHHQSEAINCGRRNPRYLSEFKLDAKIKAFSEPSETQAYKAIVIATPAQSFRSVLGSFKKQVSKNALIISAAKGIEVGSLKFPLELIGEVLGPKYQERAGVLSGPSFAIEVMQHQPTAVSIASFDRESAQSVQGLFHSPYFRAYTSGDPIGLEVAGSLKNVIAIAAGATKGLGFMSNSLAALLTRGLAELTRVGVALGADPLTFTGLGGVGDLMLTCTSEKSRNFQVGVGLGQGKTLEEVINSLGSIAEGVSTSQAAMDLARQLNLDLPIIRQVYSVIYLHKPVREAVYDLLNREAKTEFDAR